MKKNVIIFLTLLISIVFYIYYNNFNFTSAKLWIDPGDAASGRVLCSSNEEIGCPWGNSYNSDIGVRTVRRYCVNCPSTDCETIEDPWFLHKTCNDCQRCNEKDGEYVCEQGASPLSPENGQEVPSPVTLDWCDIENADLYRIRVCKEWWEDDTRKEECLDESDLKESEICARDLVPDDAYYTWQVAPCYGGLCDPFGSKWNFFTEGKQEDIGEPSLLFPLNMAGVSLPVTLEWEKVDGAKSYYVAVLDGNNIATFESPTSESISLSVGSLTNSTAYMWTVAACLGDNGNACGPKCCFNEYGRDCANFSAIRTFTTTNVAVFNDVELISPSNEASPVKPSDLFEWQSLGATGFVFEVYSTNQVIKDDTQNTTSTLSGISWQDDRGEGKLAFNTNYTWEITPCWWDTDNNETLACKTNQSETQSFTTAGGQVTSMISPDPNISETIPVLFSWEKVPNAFSYLFQFKESQTSSWSESSATQINRFSLDYPAVRPDTDYDWRVKACAETDGSFCEDDWHKKSFSTKQFQAPSSKQLEDGEVFTYEDNLIWEPVVSAKSYEYTIQYDKKSEKETSDNCIDGTPIETYVISNSNYFSMPNFPETQQKCLGQYSLWVTACLNKNCEDRNTENSKTTKWIFSYAQSASGKGGIMPCGRDYDLEDTPWNERELCQLKHIPVLIYNIIDFILWKASLIALLVLIVFSGIVSYASAGLPIKVVSIKEIWKAAGKGYLIIFFAWTIISLILNLLGITDSLLILHF